MNKWIDYVVADQGLDLRSISGRNVGNSPSCFFDNIHFAVFEQLRKERTSSCCQNRVCLGVATRNDVTNGAKSRSDNCHFSVIKKGDETGDYAGINDFLNSLVRSICEVRQSPASVGQDLFVSVVDEMGEGGQELTDGWNAWGRILVAAQVRKGPGNVSQKSSLKTSKLSRVCHGNAEK